MLVFITGISVYISKYYLLLFSLVPQAFETLRQNSKDKLEKQKIKQSKQPTSHNDD